MSNCRCACGRPIDADKRVAKLVLRLAEVTEENQRLWDDNKAIRREAFQEAAEMALATQSGQVLGAARRVALMIFANELEAKAQEAGGE